MASNNSDVAASWATLRTEVEQLIAARSPRTRERVTGQLHAFERAAFASRHHLSAAASVTAGGADEWTRALLLRYPGAAHALSKKTAQLIAGGIVCHAEDAITGIALCPWGAASLVRGGSGDRAVWAPLARGELVRSLHPAPAAPHSSLFLASALDGRVLLCTTGGLLSPALGPPLASAASRVLAVLGPERRCGSTLDIACKPESPGVFISCGGDGAVHLWRLPLWSSGGAVGSSSDVGAAVVSPAHTRDAGSGARPDSSRSRSPTLGRLDSTAALQSMILDDGSGSGSARSSLLSDAEDAWDRSTAPSGARSADVSSDGGDVAVGVDPTERKRRLSLSTSGSRLSSPDAQPLHGRAATSAASACCGGVASASRDAISNARPVDAEAAAEVTRAPLLRLPGDVMTSVAWLSAPHSGDHALCGSRSGRLLVLNAFRDVPVGEVRLQSATAVTCVASAAAAAAAAGTSSAPSAISCCTTANGQLHILDHRVANAVGVMGGGSGSSALQQPASPQFVYSAHRGSVSVNSKRKRAAGCCFVNARGQTYIATGDDSHKLRLFDVRKHRDPALFLEFPTSLGRIAPVHGGGEVPGACLIAVPQHSGCVSIVDALSMSVVAVSRRLHSGKAVLCCAALAMGGGGGGGGGGSGAVVEVVGGSILGAVSSSQFYIP